MGTRPSVATRRYTVVPEERGDACLANEDSAAAATNSTTRFRVQSWALLGFEEPTNPPLDSPKPCAKLRNGPAPPTKLAAPPIHACRRSLRQCSPLRSHNAAQIQRRAEEAGAQHAREEAGCSQGAPQRVHVRPGPRVVRYVCCETTRLSFLTAHAICHAPHPLSKDLFSAERPKRARPRDDGDQKDVGSAATKVIHAEVTARPRLR